MFCNEVNTEHVVKRGVIRRIWRSSATRFEEITHTLLGMLLIILVSASAGCGGGGGSTSSAAAPVGNSGPEEGQLIVGITDAPGDFVTYAITVQSLTFTRVNGDVVETLPFATRIDFTELTEVTELLTIATVPAGNYESAVIRLDFSDAEVLVQDDNGDAVAAMLQDANGAPLAVQDMRLQLTTTDVITIAPGRPAAFSLDFDLDASNDIDLTGAVPIVTVEPFLLATPELETDREHRVRGILERVDVAANEIDLMVRPFRHRTGQFGEFTLNVDDETQYEVDGVGYVGMAGIEAMEALAVNSPVVANGRIEPPGMMAEIVLAGNSVPWSDADVVRGVVVARQDDALTVRGAHIEFADGTRAFRGEFTVLLSDDTVVSAVGAVGLNKQSISVGQRVLAWGERADDNTLAAERVRMPLNQLTAEVEQADPLAVNLFWMNGRRPEIFDFSGTGVTAADDASPEFYEIDTGLLPLATVDNGDLVRVRGLVNEFAMAPFDFNARTLIDVETDFRAATLRVGWTDGSAEPFVATAPARIDVDLSAARKALKLRGVPVGFIDLLDDVALVARDSGMGVYAVKVRGAGEFHLFRSFNDLVDELVKQLDEGRLLHRITAQGRYNTTSAELTTGRAGFVFSTNEEQQ